MCGAGLRGMPLPALAAGLGLASAFSVAAQEATQRPSAGPPADLVFGEEIDVRVVNLEVVVEDRAGNRVDGLTSDDFRIFVDGFEVDVDYFTEILENRAIETAEGEPPPAIGDGESVPTNYLFFVDDDHTHVTFRRPVLRGFGNRLAGLGLHDQVAVVAQSRRQLRVLSPFTTDRDQTRAALEELDRGRVYGGRLRSPRLIDQGFLAGGSGPLPTGGRLTADLTSVDGDLPFSAMRVPSLLSEAQAGTSARDLEFSVTAVASTMRALDVPEGRKVLLLLAGDWPTGYFRPAGQGIGLRTDWEVLDGLVDTANLLGYTVYPMDQQTSRPSTALWRNLRHIARSTGGKAYMAGSNVEALDRVSRDTANYYWLGFVPEYRRDDRAHDVQVEVVRPDLKVRSRRGYVDLSRGTEADMETQRRLLFPSPVFVADEPVLRVDIGKAEPTGIRKMLVPVTVFVPIGVFPVLPYEDQFLARLELRFAVVDRNGQQADVPLIPLDLRGENEPAIDAVVPYEATLTLRRRPHGLVVSVHDPLSRMTVSARRIVSFR